MQKLNFELTHDGAVACLILNDGKGNVLDSIMMRDILEAFSSLKLNKNIKLISFEGAGKHFSFGASVEEHSKLQCVGMLKLFHKIFYEIIEMSIPTVAKVSGQCLGGGMELALACNFIFADKTAFFGQPEIVLGVFAPAGSVLLPMKIGSARAEEILISGSSISAEKAKEIGIVNEIFEDKDSMNSAVDEWIEKTIIPKSASSLRFAVKAARFDFNKAILTQLSEMEKIYNVELMETNDANEGINSFIEKRKPVWLNK